ncbi:hypothetical protein GCM10010424_74320 [Streptomyces lienomycini]
MPGGGGKLSDAQASARLKAAGISRDPARHQPHPEPRQEAPQAPRRRVTSGGKTVVDYADERWANHWDMRYY